MTRSEQSAPTMTEEADQGCDRDDSYFVESARPAIDIGTMIGSGAYFGRSNGGSIGAIRHHGSRSFLRKDTGSGPSVKR